MGITLDEMLLDANTSNIAISDGTNTLAVNGDGSIDVALAAGSEMQITDGTDTLEINADGSINVGNTVTVSATDLDIRDLSASQDSVSIGDGTDVLDINADGSINAVVSATDLDVRDLSHTQDSVQIGDGTDLLAINADGSLNVNLTDDGVADDAADSGNPFKVGGRAHDQSSALSAVSAGGDRFDLLGDLYRRVFVNKAANVGMKNSADTVGVTAAQVLASPLAGRQSLLIQNQGAQSIYIGFDASVSTANGVEIPKNASASFDIGEAVDVYMISGSAGQDVRFLELA